MLKTTTALLICLLSIQTKGAIRNVEIVRDSFGVPHIFGKTDADAAYGLAWAHSEDDFVHIQENLLAARGRLGEVIGKDGVLFDYALQLFSVDTLVNNRYVSDLSPDFRKVVEAYIDGINDYARLHPNEVMLPSALPFTARDVIKGYVLNTSLMAGLGMTLKALRENKLDEFMAPNDRGSNAIAIAPHRTEDGTAWLAINSHQPIEGRFAWYEAHINSDEGWNMIGGLFPGGVSVFVGSNPALGWAHTTNYHTFGDVFELKVRNAGKKQYLIDDRWEHFKSKRVRLKIKLGGIIIPVSRKILETRFGPVFKAHGKYYALRFPGYMDLRSAEQWYRMNKAGNLAEFEKAIRMDALPLFNILYADTGGNILLHSACRIPYRNESLDWKLPIKSQSSRYIWTELLPYSCKPTIYNPECGFLYNANQTPLRASSKECDWNGDFVGLQQFQFNRGERLAHLMDEYRGKFSWQDFHSIKFDKKYHPNGSYMRAFNEMYQLIPDQHTDVADAISIIRSWNLEADTGSRGATLAMLTHYFLTQHHKTPFGFLMIRKKPLEKEEVLSALRKAKKFLLASRGTLDVGLGEIQRHIRGNINLPASGMKEVLRATEAKLIDKKKGIFRTTGGDGYIQMCRFGREGVSISSINAYGASHRPESRHYNDQMTLFGAEKFKPMTFDKDEILRLSEKIYRPGYPAEMQKN